MQTSRKVQMKNIFGYERNNSLYIGLPQTENNVKNIENDDKPHHNNQISTLNSYYKG